MNCMFYQGSRLYYQGFTIKALLSRLYYQGFTIKVLLSRLYYQGFTIHVRIFAAGVVPRVETWLLGGGVSVSVSVC